MESDINLGDLENLEKELNSDTFAINKEDNGSSFHEIKSSLFGGGTDDNESKIKINIVNTGDDDQSGEGGGLFSIKNQETEPAAPVQKTWDGFATFNDIPIGENKTEPKPQMSKED